MQTRDLLLITCIAILVIVVIYVAFIYTTNTPYKLYKASIGTADDNAIRALDALRHVTAPRDRFLRAQINLYNVLHDDNLQLQPTTVNNILNDAANDYFATLDALRAGHQPQPDIFGGQNEPNVEFMLFEIGAFNDMYQPGVLFEGALDETVASTTPGMIVERKTAAISAAETPAEAVDKYFEASTTYTDNPQNVHDSAINSDLRNVYARMKSYSGRLFLNSDAAIQDAVKYIQSKIATASAEESQKYMRALAVINERIIHKGSISTFNDTEDNIFAAVWARTDARENAHNRDKLRDAVIDALADCHERGEIVCINGRTARMLNSLATLDADDVIAASALTKEAYRNQIFEETRKIISREIESAKLSTDPVMAAVGNYYDGAEDDDMVVDSDDAADIDENTRAKIAAKIAAKKEFIKNVKHEIDLNLRQYAGKFRNEELKKIANECYAGIDF